MNPGVVNPGWRSRRWRDLPALAGLVAVTAGFVWVAQRFAVRGVLLGGLVASALGLAIALYLVARAWRALPPLGLTYRLTRHGVLYILAVFLVAVGALVSANNLLFLVLACMLAALLVSGLFSRLNLASLELHCAAPDDIFAGQDVPVRLLLKNLKRWMPSFAIRLQVDLPGLAGNEGPEVYFPMLAGGQSCSTILSLRFPRRGRYQQDTFWLRSGFPFGLLVRSVRLRLPREILVYPSVEPSLLLEAGVPQSASDWERRRSGLGQDLYRIRPYQTGDSSRVVHWKASAHTGELKVREFTREEDRRVEVFFDRAIPEGPEWRERFERAVELCAALVWQLHIRGGGLCFHPGAHENVYDILKYLALVAPWERGYPLPVEPSGVFQVIFTAAGPPANLPESSYYCYLLESL
ncbi:MAG: DUF58 domain-containing protein [Acidobacteria bacterium]|nr:DUF58 domain-containing protein [Acidobacteriota bacterium]